MLCKKCGQEIQEGWKVCPNCGAKIEDEIENKKCEDTVHSEKEKSSKSIIPGFRTNKLWKKVIAVMGYLAFALGIFGIIAGKTYGNTTDQLIYHVGGLIMYIFVFLVVLIIGFNFLGIRDKLPLFKRHKLGSGILGVILTLFFVGIVVSIVEYVSGTLYSDSYVAEREAALAEKQAELAEKQASSKDEKKEEKEIEASKDADADEMNEEKSGNILRGEAKDSNDLTGTYIDEEDDMMLQIIVQGNTATYSLSNLDGTETEVEQNCEITDNYFGGKLYYFSLNLDGTLAISSGAGGTWGRFVKTSNKAEIDLSYDIGNYDEETAKGDDKYDTSTPLGKLKSCANESGCTRGYFELEHGNNSDWSEHTMEMEDDGSYFDEVVLGAWFNSDGTPVADYPPKRLWDANYLFNLARFYFLDGETNSLDTLKRGNPSDMNTYALVLTNIQKGSSFGDGYFQGWDYISKEPVIVHGNFNGLMNGDNVLVFARYNGLASDDTPNFKGFYVEIINYRGI